MRVVNVEKRTSSNHVVTSHSRCLSLFLSLFLFASTSFINKESSYSCRRHSGGCCCLLASICAMRSLQPRSTTDASTRTNDEQTQSSWTGEWAEEKGEGLCAKRGAQCACVSANDELINKRTIGCRVDWKGKRKREAESTYKALQLCGYLCRFRVVNPFIQISALMTTFIEIIKTQRSWRTLFLIWGQQTCFATQIYYIVRCKRGSWILEIARVC